MINADAIKKRQSLSLNIKTTILVLKAGSIARGYIGKAGINICFTAVDRLVKQCHDSKRNIL
jgi:hypothetical protein